MCQRPPFTGVHRERAGPTCLPCAFSYPALASWLQQSQGCRGGGRGSHAPLGGCGDRSQSAIAAAAVRCSRHSSVAQAPRGRRRPVGVDRLRNRFGFQNDFMDARCACACAFLRELPHSVNPNSHIPKSSIVLLSQTPGPFPLDAAALPAHRCALPRRQRCQSTKRCSWGGTGQRAAGRCGLRL